MPHFKALAALRRSLSTRKASTSLPATTSNDVAKSAVAEQITSNLEVACAEKVETPAAVEEKSVAASKAAVNGVDQGELLLLPFTASVSKPLAEQAVAEGPSATAGALSCVILRERMLIQSTEEKQTGDEKEVIMRASST